MLPDAGSAAGRAGNFARMAEVGRRAAALPSRGAPIDELQLDLVVGVGALIEGRTAEHVPPHPGRSGPGGHL